MARLFLVLGACSAAIAVAAGAFGAHALRARVEPRLLEVFETGVRYQMYHALALMAVALMLARVSEAGTLTRPLAGPSATPSATRSAARWVVASGWLFAAGTVAFSGSLYAMTLTGARWLGAITPVGGVCFIAAWVCLSVAALKRG